MKKRPITTILKHTDIQLIDNMEEILNKLAKNINFNHLIYEYLDHDVTKTHNFSSDSEKYHCYYCEVERNKDAYLDLLEIMRKNDEENKEIILRLIDYVKGDIPKEALEDYTEE